MLKVAINGFGRIGRNSFKIGLQKGVEFVAINDLTDTKTLAYLLKHDTAYGAYDKEVDYDPKNLIVDGKKYPVFAEKDPKNLPWKSLKVDVVLECTGFFVSEEGASNHLQAGAKKVIISAPAKGGNVPTFLMGVNADKMTGSETIISNASCTTNCIAPVIEIIKQSLGVKKSAMTTIHAYTAKQAVQDAPDKNLRDGRSAFANMIPSTTGAATTATKTIPELTGKFDGISIRVPIIVGSLADLTIVTEKKTTVEEVNKIIKDYSSREEFSGIVSITEEELVSSDFIGSTFSAVVDAPFTKVIDGDLVKILAWYDNEWGYSNRLIDLAMKINK